MGMWGPACAGSPLPPSPQQVPQPCSPVCRQVDPCLRVGSRLTSHGSWSKRRGTGHRPYLDYRRVPAPDPCPGPSSLPAASRLSSHGLSSLTSTALRNTGRAFPTPSLRLRDPLQWWVWGNCAEVRRLPSTSHWGARCQCDLLLLTLTPGLRCQPGSSSVQKCVTQSGHSQGRGLRAVTPGPSQVCLITPAGPPECWAARWVTEPW